MEDIVVCSYYDGQVNTCSLGRVQLSYLPGENRLWASGGAMDCYYDCVYKLKDGIMEEIAKGEYGAEDNSNVQWDEDGYPVYQYFWNGEEVTENTYDKKLNKAYKNKSEQAVEKLEWYDSVYHAYESFILNKNEK